MNPTIEMLMSEAAQGCDIARAKLERMGYAMETTDTGGASVILRDMRAEMLASEGCDTGADAGGMVACNGGGNEYYHFDWKPKTGRDETALIALAAMRELTGLDYTDIIQRLGRVKQDIPF